MYLIILRSEKVVEISMSYSILGVLWLDVFMEVYHKRYEVLRISSRFQARFYIKILVLLILVADEFMFVYMNPESIKPLVIFRCSNFSPIQLFPSSTIAPPANLSKLWETPIKTFSSTSPSIPSSFSLSPSLPTRLFKSPKTSNTITFQRTTKTWEKHFSFSMFCLPMKVTLTTSLLLSGSPCGSTYSSLVSFSWTFCSL